MSETSDLILVGLLLAIAGALGLAAGLKALCGRARRRRDKAELTRILNKMTPAERAVRLGDVDDLAGGDDA